MKQEMPKQYQPQQFESEMYREWEEKGYFKAHRDPAKKPFTIIMPPPNITGQLHMGHAMDGTMQDALIRYHRMKGEAALWLPGTDHAVSVFGPEGYETTTEAAASEFRYDAVQCICETPDYFVLFLGKRHGQLSRPGPLRPPVRQRRQHAPPACRAWRKRPDDAP